MGTWARHFQNCESDAPIWPQTQAAAFMDLWAWSVGGYWIQIAQLKGIRIPESGKFFIVESGILGFGIGNTAQGIGNATNESGIQVPLTKSRNPVPGIRNPESKTVLDSFTFGEA